MLASHAVLGLSRQLADRRAAEPANEVQVVGAEVLHDADVADSRREGADPLGRDQEDLAELAGLHAAAQLLERRVEALDVADGSVQPGSADQRDQLRSLRRIGGDRLLDKDADARGDQLAHNREVLSGRHRCDREVGAPLDELLDRGQDVAGVLHRAEAVAGLVDRAGELDSRVGLEDASVVAADHAQPHDSTA